MSVGATCKVCQLPIKDWMSPERRKWCEDMRGLLILNGLRPEDYHQDCFIDVVTGFSQPAKKTESGTRVISKPLYAGEFRRNRPG